MKKKILSFMVLGLLIIASIPKEAEAECITIDLPCYSGYVICGINLETRVEAMLAALEVCL